MEPFEKSSSPKILNRIMTLIVLGYEVAPPTLSLKYSQRQYEHYFKIIPIFQIILIQP